MARLLVTCDKSWYWELSAVGFYGETEFEEIVLQHARSIFPDFITIPFKKDIEDSSGEKKRPDLALIRKDYKMWWIVEVEMSDHQWQHVSEQIQVFRYGKYSSPEIYEYVSAQLRKRHRGLKVNHRKLRSLIRSVAPSILLIVDSDKEEWENSLIGMNVDLCVFEIYKNLDSKYSYRLRGKYPFIVHSKSPCRYNKNLTNSVEVIEDGVLEGLRDGDEIEIVYDGELTKWALLKEKKKSYLRFLGNIPPFTSHSDFVLLKSSQKRFFLKRS